MKASGIFFLSAPICKRKIHYDGILYKEKMTSWKRMINNLTPIMKRNYNFSGVIKRKIALLLMAAAVFAGCAPEPQPTPIPELVREQASPAAPTLTPAPTEVSCSLPQPGPEEWPVVVCQTFDEGSGILPEEEQNNEFAFYTAGAVEGEYSVDYIGRLFEGYTRSALTFFNIGNMDKFAISVDGTILSGSTETSWGVAFGSDENYSGFYLFTIFNDNSFILEEFLNGEYETLIPRTLTPVIKYREANNLTVTSQSNNYVFSINGIEVGSYQGESPAGDLVMLAVSAFEGSNATFLIDNLVVKSPSF